MNGTNKIRTQLKRGSPTILTCIGAIGMLITTISAVKATPDAMERIKYDSRFNHDGDSYAYTKAEAVKSAWRCYIPAATFGLSTLACMFGANALNKQQQASLASAYMLLNKTYKEFAKKDIDGSIRKAIVKDKIADEDISVGDETCLFYEFNYGELFERRRSDILSAEHRFNQLFISRGYASLNDFYELIDLPTSEIGETIGWGQDEGYPWIDFEHELVELEDGMKCYLIWLPDQPTPNYI